MKSVTQKTTRHFEKKFQCQICSRKFKYPKLLREHIQGLHEKKIKCVSCGKCFTTGRALKDHIRLKSCEKIINNLDSERMRKFDCESCNLTFSHSFKLQMHDQKHHGMKGKYQKLKTEKNRCPICLMECNEYLILLKHLKIEHNYDRARGFLGSKGGEPLTCFHCNQQFSSGAKKVLIKHLINEHFPSMKPKFECRICLKNYSSKKSLRNHIFLMHEKRLKCEKCGTHFYDKQKRDVHIAQKNCNKSLRKIEVVPFFKRDGYFECNYCYFNSEQETEFNQHFYTEHKSQKCRIKSHRCPICWVLPYNVRKHLKNVHGYDPRDSDWEKTEQKFLECDHCDGKFHFAHKSKLEKHLLKEHFPLLAATVLRAENPCWQSTLFSLRIVEENGKFRCKTCNKLSKTRKIAVFHSRYICHRNWTASDFETETERIFFECFHCGEKFKQCEKWKLIFHMKRQHIQKDTECHICSKSFKYACFLKEHIEGVHEKKIKCEKCQKCFKRKYGQTKHVRENCCKLWSKDELKSFAARKRPSKADLTCNICSKMFQRPCRLRNHIESVHEKKIKAKCEMCGQTFTYKGLLRKHLRFNLCKKE